MANYGQRFGDRFTRTQSIADVGGLRVLDLLDPKSRAAVLAHNGTTTALYENNEISQPYM